MWLSALWRKGASRGPSHSAADTLLVTLWALLAHDGSPTHAAEMLLWLAVTALT